MINSGVIKLYAGTGEFLAQKKYYTKGGRKWIIDEWMESSISKKLNFYYHILPDEVEGKAIKGLHQKTVIPDKEKPKFTRPAAVYDNIFKPRVSELN